MNYRVPARLASLVVVAALAGCASDGGSGLATGSLSDTSGTVAAAPKVDPVCVALTSRIDALRKEGTIEKLEKAAAGKSTSVQVKRTALAKQADLNKAYAEYQDKCSTLAPRVQSAAAATAPGAAAPAVAAATPAVPTTTIAKAPASGTAPGKVAAEAAKR